ncbi:MAG: mechanosensitive ion channel domain-containing protein [Pseudomonadota bacterium]
MLSRVLSRILLLLSLAAPASSFAVLPGLPIPGVTPAPSPAPASPAPANSPDQAQQRLDAAQKRIQAAKALLRDGDAQLASIQVQLAQPPAKQPDLDDLDVEALESLRQKALLEEQDAALAVSERDKALNALETQQFTVPDADSVSDGAAGDTPAQKALQDRLGAALAAEKEAFDLEISSQPIAIQLGRAQLKLAERRYADIRARLQAIDQKLDAARLSAARATLQEAPQQDAFAAYPRLHALAESNQSLGHTLVSLTERLTVLSRERERLTQETARLQGEMQALRRQLEQFGFGPIMGRLLLEKRSTLPSRSDMRQQSQDNRALLETLQAVEMQVQQESRQLGSPQELLAELSYIPPATAPEGLRNAAQKLIDTRKSIFERLEAIKSPILQAVAGLDYAQSEQRRTVEEYKRFIAQNLLWLPNDRPLWGQSLSVQIEGMLALFGALEPTRLFADAWRAASDMPLRVLLFSLMIGGLLLLTPRLHSALSVLLAASARPDFRVWSGALRSLSILFLLALPMPLLLTGFGLLLHDARIPLHDIIAANLFGVASVWMNIRLFLLMTRHGGLAESMFGWNPGSLAPLRATFRWLLYFAVPLDFLTSVHVEMSQVLRTESSGQWMLLLLLLLLALLLARLLSPKGEFVRHWQAIHPAHWLSRNPGLVFTLTVGTLLFLALINAEGYTYSAGVLTQTLASSLWILLAVTVLKGFADMSLNQAYRRLAMQRRQRERQNASQGADADDGEGIAQLVELDMQVVARQSGKLLDFSLLLLFAFALYFVWAPVLPAFGLLDQVSLWQIQQTADGKTVSSAFSLGDALFTFLMLFALWVAARNLPGLMEIILEQWTTHEAGTRYAITTVLRYFIIFIGVLVLLGGLGIQWSQLQWLVAALVAALGFGMQEIFTNLVAGLMILLERPVRVGDQITVGDQTGIVRRIHIRATVLEDFDRKEIIVPNKELVLKPVTNWTLTDTTTRILVDVGVAYGCDTRQVERLLLQAAASVPRLLVEPAPLVWFMGFGDSALNFRVRAYVSDADIKLGVTSDLNYAIEAILREHGISIPFPQRDVHIPGLEGLTAAITRREGADHPQGTTT